MNFVTVREYGRLSTLPVASSLDEAMISASAFNWLVEQSYRGKIGASLITMDGPHSLRVASHVGVLETPCGTRIEILPKHIQGGQEVAESRRLLIRLVRSALRLKAQSGGVASLENVEAPLTEWLASQLLTAVGDLLKRGFRQDYERTSGRERHMRGRLQVHRQLRNGPGRSHMFEIEHDVFSFDRPENRLIAAAVQRVLKSTRSSSNWALAREISVITAQIPATTNVREDFEKWDAGRLMSHYEHVRPLCELILLGQLPFSVTGPRAGISMLFPMERLFEDFVSRTLERQLSPELKVKVQVSNEYLCTWQGTGFFKLRPDVLVTQGQQRWVIDAKWKLLSSDPSRSFGIDQADIYQLFAYGHKYLAGAGDVYLVYPSAPHFSEPRGPFQMSEGLNLHVVPIDMRKGEIALDLKCVTAACYNLDGQSGE